MTTHKTLAPILTAAIEDREPVFIWGAPGIGKSDLARQAAAGAGLPIIDLRAVLLDPVDLRGLPAAQDGRAVWLPMGELPDAARDGTHGVLFLDELNAAPPAVQAACLGLVLDRKLGEYRLPEGWTVLAAGNRTTDRASAQRMSSALANRFEHHELTVDLDAWCLWALDSGIAPELVAFLRFKPDLLHDFQGDRTVNATPRTWARVGKVLARKSPADVELARVTGLVGEGPAAELFAFLKVWRTLPSPDAVLMNPDTADVPIAPATLFALAGALAYRVTEQTMDAFARYLDRLPPEFGVMAMRDATARKPHLEKTAAAIRYYAANAAVYT